MAGQGTCPYRHFRPLLPAWASKQACRSVASGEVPTTSVASGGPLTYSKFLRIEVYSRSPARE